MTRRKDRIAASKTRDERAIWSPKTGKDRIVLVTSDRALDREIRKAFTGESYEIVTVADFIAEEERMKTTNLAILDFRQGWDMRLVHHLESRPSYWEGYPHFALIAPRTGDIMCNYPWTLLEMEYPGNPKEFVFLAKVMIRRGCTENRYASPI